MHYLFCCIQDFLAIKKCRYKAKCAHCYADRGNFLESKMLQNYGITGIRAELKWGCLLYNSSPPGRWMSPFFGARFSLIFEAEGRNPTQTIYLQQPVPSHSTQQSLKPSCSLRSLPPSCGSSIEPLNLVEASIGWTKALNFVKWSGRLSNNVYILRTALLYRARVGSGTPGLFPAEAS